MASPLSGSLARTIGAAFNGLFLDAVLTRDGAPTGPSYDPTPGTPVSYPCKAIRDSYGIGYRSGGLVNAEDVKIIILQTSLAIRPAPGDRITITEHGETFTIVPPGAGQPSVVADPANATWECRGSL